MILAVHRPINLGRAPEIRFRVMEIAILERSLAQFAEGRRDTVVIKPVHSLLDRESLANSYRLIGTVRPHRICIARAAMGHTKCLRRTAGSCWPLAVTTEPALETVFYMQGGKLGITLKKL